MLKKIITALVLLGLLVPTVTVAITKPTTKLEMCTLKHDLTEWFGPGYEAGVTISSIPLEEQSQIPDEFPDGVTVKWNDLDGGTQAEITVEQAAASINPLLSDTCKNYVKAIGTDTGTGPLFGGLNKTQHDNIDTACQVSIILTKGISPEVGRILSLFRAKAVGAIGAAFREDAGIACLFDLIETFADWFFVFLLVIAGVFILWGAYTFISAGGAPEKLKTARNILIWALVGMAVAFISKGLVKIVEQLISA